MTEALAILGLIATVNATGTIALALYVSRQREQVKHLKDLVTTLIREYEQTTGNRVAVDKALLGEPTDVVADEGTDLFSQMPDIKPWGIR